MSTHLRVLCCVLFFAAMTLAGCSVGGGTGEVSGSVTVDGQAVSEGMVTFLDAENKPHNGSIKDGKYKVNDVPSGKSKVFISPPIPIALGPGPAPPAPKGPAVPNKYRDPKTSGLEFEVKSGGNQIDIPLKAT
jgi:hypothetical protein